MKIAIDYYGPGGTAFTPFASWAGGNIKILPKLIGKPWDDFALAACHIYKPSSIRVNTGMCYCDSDIGRITVIVDENNIITNISQEIHVAIPPSIKHGNFQASKQKILELI